MDNSKIGNLIYQIRKNKDITQKQLAEQIGVSDKAISKWERGIGFPDITILPELAKFLNISIDSFLSGELNTNEREKGNMKNQKFYFCDQCGNIITSTNDTTIECCSKKLERLEATKSDDAHLLKVQMFEDEIFISSNHEMSKSHFITFIAYIKSDGILLTKLYPEWDMNLTLKNWGRGKLIYHCKNDGLFYQYIT